MACIELDRAQSDCSTFFRDFSVVGEINGVKRKMFFVHGSFYIYLAVSFSRKFSD